jgi:parallel beta helix pectate lyase-like protein
MENFGPQPTWTPEDAIILHVGDNVSAIVNAAPSGATFYFDSGIYRGVSTTPKNGQTFIGAEGAILNGSAVLTKFTQQGNLWVADAQAQRGRVHNNAGYESGFQRAGYPEAVFIDNVPLKPVDALSKVVPGTFYFDYNVDRIYIADNPAGHTIEAGKLQDAFNGSAQNVTVQNFIIEKYNPSVQNGAIQGGRNWTIQDNEVRLNYAVGITARDGSKILGNYVHDNGQMGLGGSGDNILVEGNELAKNGFWSGVDVLWEAGGFKFANTDNLIVRGNYSHDNHGSGMWTDIDNIRTLYEYNLVIRNTHIGITHEISYDAVIRNNTLIGNGYRDPRGWLWGAEVQIQNSKNVDVYGNRIDMTGGGNGVVVIQQNRGSGEFGPYVATGNHIHDNVFVDHDSNGLIGGVADYNWSGVVNGDNTWDNNRFYMPNMGNRFWWGGPYNFAGFESHTTGAGNTISQSYPNTDDWIDPPGDINRRHGQ